MAPFLLSILQVDEGTTTISAFSWYIESSSKKFVLIALALIKAI
jgi:hypothetical protein